MEITIHPTTKIVYLTESCSAIPARIWEGKTSTGLNVYAFITRIATDADTDQTDFLAALKEQEVPSPAARSFPLSMIL